MEEIARQFREELQEIVDRYKTRLSIPRIMHVAQDVFHKTLSIRYHPELHKTLSNEYYKELYSNESQPGVRMKYILLWIWQFPQNIIGFIFSRFACKRTEEYYIVPFAFGCGVTLGEYIIFDKNAIVDVNDINHEKGHRIQSRYLGVFYLLVIGLPSMIGNIYDRTFHSRWHVTRRIDWYYGQPWEESADKLGGVKR